MVRYAVRWVEARCRCCHKVFERHAGKQQPRRCALCRRGCLRVGHCRRDEALRLGEEEG